MNKREKVQFVKSLVDMIEHKILIEILEDKIPLEWDGIELRWLLAERFNTNWVMPEAKKRKREFRNTLLIRNL